MAHSSNSANIFTAMPDSVSAICFSSSVAAVFVFSSCSEEGKHLFLRFTNSSNSAVVMTLSDCAWDRISAKFPSSCFMSIKMSFSSSVDTCSSDAARSSLEMNAVYEPTVSEAMYLHMAHLG